MYAILFTLALPLLAAALPSGGDSQCDTGSVQCCNQVQPAGSPDASQALGLANIILDNINTPVGLGCSPVNIIGVGSGGNCANAPVCCQDVYQGGLAVGCTPINTNI